MRRFIILTLTLAAWAWAAPAGARCSGADPAITKASVVSVTPSGGLNNVKVSVTVTNLGSAKQPSNTLQSVEITQNDTKVGRKGVPPLAAGQAYTFAYVFQRSVEASPGTTPLRLQLVVTQPSNADCDASNDVYHLRV